MEIQDINDLANDVAVSRLEIQAYESELTKLKGYQEILDKISEAKTRKEEAQSKLMEAMKENQLKSWKTEQATFSKATRFSASINPTHKKEIENRLKDGEIIEGWELKTSEYLSIRNLK